MRWMISMMLAGAVTIAATPPDKAPKKKTTTATTTSARTASTKTVSTKTGAGKTTATKTTHPTASLHAASARGRRGKNARSRRPAAPSYQLHPDPERYQQIQQALADRGYYKGTVDGTWNDDSSDALKRFQTDQKLDADGKINALTLTGLGLGPKHDGTSAGTVPLSAAEPGTNGQPDVPAVTEVPQGAETPTTSEPGSEPRSNDPQNR